MSGNVKNFNEDYELSSSIAKKMREEFNDCEEQIQFITDNLYLICDNCDSDLLLIVMAMMIKDRELMFTSEDSNEQDQTLSIINSVMEDKANILRFHSIVGGFSDLKMKVNDYIKAHDINPSDGSFRFSINGISSAYNFDAIEKYGTKQEKEAVKKQIEKASNFGVESEHLKVH